MFENLLFNKNGIELLEQFRSCLKHKVTLPPTEEHVTSDGHVHIGWYDQLVSLADQWFRDPEGNACNNGLPSIPELISDIANNQRSFGLSYTANHAHFYVGRDNWYFGLYALPEWMALETGQFRHTVMELRSNTRVWVNTPYCCDCTSFNDNREDLENAVRIFAESLALRGNSWIFWPYRRVLELFLETGKIENIADLLKIYDDIVDVAETSDDRDNLSYTDFFEIWEKYNISSGHRQREDQEQEAEKTAAWEK